MVSQHRKQRQWRKEVGRGKRLFDEVEKGKGATVRAVHPSEKQPVNPSEKVTGATFGSLSKIWPSVKWISTLG